MEETNNNSGSESDVGYQKVVRILKLKKSWSRRAEMIVAVMSGYEDIVGRAQDAGKDKPFDLRAPDDAVRIDVKTQKNGELNVKREKFGKQLLAWAAAGERFLPVQVVVDSKTAGWYLAPGIPRAPRTPLDPLDTVFDPNDPGRPFCIGQCLLVDLKTRERFEAMRAKLNQGLKDVKKNKERILARVREEHQEYINEVAQHAIDNDKMHAAVIRSIASSPKAMSNLGKSDEAMANLAQSDEAMAKLAQSDEAMMKILGPEMFQIWKARRSRPAE
jgi:hypothetical protein